jgi:hypothetical protein
MTCEQVKEEMADYLTGSLSAPAAEELSEHFTRCAACRQETEALSETWRMLGLLDQEQPSPALRARFYQSPEAFQQGLAAAAPPPPRRWWAGIPAVRIAWSAALLLVGIGIGLWLHTRDRGQAELAQLQDEVHSMRQMVTLSLLQQQSASERLRGVDYAYRVDQSDSQVLSALLHAVNHDPSVNVRLAAVDALRKFGNSPAVRNNVDKALAKQDSPLVQIALIDFIVDNHDRSAVSSLQALERSAAVNKDVKERAVWGLDQLQ